MDIIRLILLHLHLVDKLTKNQKPKTKNQKTKNKKQKTKNKKSKSKQTKRKKDEKHNNDGKEKFCFFFFLCDETK